jgi:transcriptional regulator with XRE-family HTH domain
MTKPPSSRSKGGDLPTAQASGAVSESPLIGPRLGDVQEMARQRNLRRSVGRKLARVIAARVRQLREARGWSQEQLASETGLSKDGVSRIERGDRTPRLETLERVAIAVGYPLARLVDVGEQVPRIRRSRASERHAHLIQKSLEQLPPWLAEAMSLVVRIILRAARESKRRSGHRQGARKKNVVKRDRAGSHAADGHEGGEGGYREPRRCHQQRS